MLSQAHLRALPYRFNFMKTQHTHSFLLATTAILLSNCGSVKVSEEDAGTNNDAGVVIDAGVLEPDAQAIGTVTVSVFADDLPAEGVVVFTNDVNGDYLTSGLTNVNGIVKFDSFPRGGTVTAAARAFGDGTTSTSKMLSSVTLVEVGETITFGRSRLRRASGNGLTEVGTLAVILPGPFAGATRFEQTVACETRGADSDGGNSTIYDGCYFQNGTMDAVAYASNETRERLAYSFDTTVLAGKIGDLTGSVILPDWQTDMGIYAAELTDSPQDGLLAISSFLGLNQGLPFGEGERAPVQLQEGGSATLEAKIAPNFHDESVVTVQALLGIEAQNSISTVAFREDGGPAASSTITKTVNLRTELMDLINNLAVSDTSPLEVTWDSTSLACKDNPEPDGLVLVVTGETESETYEWVMLTPGTTPSGVTLPQIDSGLAATLWPEAAFTQVESGLVFKGNSLQTYADLRTKPYNLSTEDLVPYRANSVQCLASAGKLPR